MKKLMILGAGILQLPAILKAREIGLTVIAVDMDSDAVGFREEGVISEVISTIDTPSVLEAAKRHRIDGIITLASDMPMMTVAVVAQELGLVGVSEETAIKTTNKARMRKCFWENHIPSPRFCKVKEEEEFLDKLRCFAGECIVKPVDSSGSRGVILLRDIANVDEVNNAFQYSKSCSRVGEIVIEEHMCGPEVSVETMSEDGECHVIQITDKLTSGAPYFVELGHSEPSTLSEDIQNSIKTLAKAAVRAVGIENGPSHTEIIVTEEGPKMVELGARLGGDNITTHLVPLSTGVDIVESCIRIALGESPDLTPKFHKGSAIRYFSTPPGKLIGINGVIEASAIEGVRKVTFVKEVGDEVKEVKNSIDRIGFVIAQSNTPASAVENCERAIDLIEIDIERKI